ncbi:MAG: hypothetical protein JWP27_1328 [Flaviaesturariibacter sp.]|nr:hypothetical protein [Flaviaesturariibacter sp.]
MLPILTRHRKSERAPLLSLVLLTLLLIASFLLRLADPPIRIWDEARQAHNALYMHLHGDWLVTHFDGQPDMWNTKPPFLIWIQALLMKLIGINEWAVRLPAAATSIATGILLWHWARRYLQNPWTGFLAGSVLASTYAYVYIHGGRFGEYDAPVTLCVCLYAYCLFCYRETARARYLFLFWLAAAVAVLIKSVAGLLMLPGLGVYLLVQKQVLRILRTPAFYGGALAFLAIVGGFYVLRESHNHGYLQAVYENELGGRFATTIENHRHPFLYYLNNMKNWRYAYWFYLIIPAFAAGFAWGTSRSRRLSLFNLCVIIPYWLIISSAQTKLEWYDLQLYPFLALQIGIGLQAAYSRTLTRLPTAGHHWIVAPLLFVAVFAVPFRSCWKQVYAFSERWWDEPAHASCYFIRSAIADKKNLDGYVFLAEGYQAPLSFYLSKLWKEGGHPVLQGSVDGLLPGTRVVVNQDVLRQQLLKRYVVREEKRLRYGCTIYQITASL